MSTRMQQRRGTASQWTISDPVLAEGELGWESDTNQFKIGDGVNNWSLLEYFQDSAAVSGSLDDYVPLTLLGVSDGVATLDGTGNIPVSQLGNIIDSAPAALDTLNELAAALSDDANAFSTLTAYADQAEADAKTYADGLAANYDAAGSAAVAEANAAAYTDGEITTLESSLQSYADTAEADAKAYADGLASNYDAAGSASTAESNANAYTDSLIGDGTVDGTAGNTVTDRIATAVSNLIDSAPATLDTLNELAAALNDDASAFTTLTAYADQAEADAISTANSYTDSAVASAQPTFTNNFMLMGA